MNYTLSIEHIPIKLDFEDDARLPSPKLIRRINEGHEELEKVEAILPEVIMNLENHLNQQKNFTYAWLAEDKVVQSYDGCIELLKRIDEIFSQNEWKVTLSQFIPFEELGGANICLAQSIEIKRK